MFGPLIRPLRAVVLGALLALAAPPLAIAQGAGPGDEGRARPAPGVPPVTRVIVRFRAGTDAGERAQARRAVGTPLEETLPIAGMELVDPEQGLSVTAAVARLERRPEVLYAEPDVPRRVVATPDDDFFVKQWGLHNTGQSLGSGDAPGTADADIDAPEAWDFTTGSPSVTVAVIDTGVDMTHRELLPNRWTNPGESGGGRETNRVDDDRNGHIDDVHGWDFVGRDNSPSDLKGHGTHVAGTVAARGNDGEGVAGVSWTSKIASLRVLDADGNGYVSDAIQAYGYAARMRIPVVNASLGGSQGSLSERDAIASASSTLFVVAAGNGGVDGVGDNNDVAGEYPCSYDAANVVCVAASNDNDALATFSNFGRESVDLVAPGVDIASTYLAPERWVYMDGTSMASPHAAGAAALVLARDPAATTAEVRGALLATVDRRPAFACTTATGGRLNAFAAVSAMAPGAPRPVAPADDPCTPTEEPTPPPEQTTPPPEETTPPATSEPAPPPAAPAPPPDTIGPAISIRTASRQRLGAVLRRGLRPRLGSSEIGRLTAWVQVSPRVARRYRLARSARTTRIAYVARTWSAAGVRTVTIRFSRRARRRLARARSVTVTLRVRAVDGAGNSSTRSKRITLRR